MEYSKLTPEIHARICALLRTGNYRETAAAAAGITARSLRNWLHRGADGVEPFAAFAAECAVAEAEGELRDVELIGRAADQDWRAAAWRLEHRNPFTWGNRDRPNPSTADTQTLADATPQRAAELVRQAFGGVTPDGAAEIESGHDVDAPRIEGGAAT